MCIYITKLHFSSFWGPFSSDHVVVNLPWPGTRCLPCRAGCHRRWSGPRLPKRWRNQSTPQRVFLSGGAAPDPDRLYNNDPPPPIQAPWMAATTGFGHWRRNIRHQWKQQGINTKLTLYFKCCWCYMAFLHAYLFIYYIYSLPQWCMWLFWVVECVHPSNFPYSYLMFLTWYFLIDCTWVTLLLTIKDIWFDLKPNVVKN